MVKLDTDNYIEKIARKHGVSAYQLMNHLGISFKNNKYVFNDVTYQTYVDSIRAAVAFNKKYISSASSLSEDTKNFKSANGNNTSNFPAKLILAIFFIPLVLWPFILPVSIMLFYAPGSENQMTTFIAALSIWSYPVSYFLGRYMSKLTAKKEPQSDVSIYWAFLPIINFIVFFGVSSF